jgi:hypothetical protein
MRTRRMVTATMVAALLLAGCGDDGEQPVDESEAGQEMVASVPVGQWAEQACARLLEAGTTEASAVVDAATSAPPPAGHETTHRRARQAYEQLAAGQSPDADGAAAVDELGELLFAQPGCEPLLDAERDTLLDLSSRHVLDVIEAHGEPGQPLSEVLDDAGDDLAGVTVEGVDDEARRLEVVVDGAYACVAVSEDLTEAAIDAGRCG